MQSEEVGVEDVEDLLYYLEPLVRGLGTGEAGSLAQALQELEAGGSSHRLMARLGTRLRTTMGGQVQELVARECRESMTAEAMQEVAPQLLASIVSSVAWQQLVSSVRMEVAAASRKATDKLATGEAGQQQQASNSLGSTWHQSNFSFLQPEQLQLLERQLGGAEGEEGRVTALHTLTTTQLSDVVGGVAWAAMVPGLQRALGDPDPQVANLGLLIHARLLVSGSHLAVREGFISLTETVASWYLDRRTHTLLPSCGLSSASPLHSALLGTLSLLTSVAVDLPRMWLRYPHRYVEDMVDGTVALLSISSPGRYSPLTILAVLDPQASWLTHWLHLSLSRSLLLTKLTKAKKIVQDMVAQVISFLKDKSFTYFEEVKADFHMFKSQRVFSLVSAKVVEFAEFHFQLRFLVLLLRQRQGRHLLQKEEEELHTHLLHFLSLPQVAEWPGRLICSSLVDLLSGSASPPTSLIQAISALATRIPSLHHSCLPAVLTLLKSPALWPITCKADVASGLVELMKRGPGADLEILVTTAVERAAREPSAFLVREFRHLYLLSSCLNAGSAAGMLLRSPNLTLGEYEVGLSRSPGLVARAPPPAGARPLRYVSRLLGEAWAALVGDHRPEWPEDEEEVGRRMEEWEEQLLVLLTSPQCLPATREDEDDFARALGLHPGSERHLPMYNHLLLRLLTVSCCSLPVNLHLQEHHRLKEVVTTRVDVAYVTTEDSLHWMFLLEQTKKLGGARERPWPSLDVSSESNGEVTQVGEAEAGALEDHMSGSGLYDLGWVEEAGKVYMETRKAERGHLPWPTVAGVLQGWARVHQGEAVEGRPRSGGKQGDLMVLEYGERVGALPPGGDHMEALRRVMEVARGMCPPRQTYDWTVATLFIMMQGDVALATSLLSALTTTLVGRLIWPNLSPSSLLGLGHCVDALLHTELPAIAAALHGAHLPASVIVHIWLSQAFVNVLDLPEITDFVLTSLLFGPDYPVYFCISLLRHLQPSILEEPTAGLLRHLLTRPVRGFTISANLSFMADLAGRHRNTVIPYLTSVIDSQYARD